MKNTRFALVAMITICLGASAALWSCSPAEKQEAQTPAAPAAMTPEQKVARGEYLTTVMSCGDCHTPGGLYGDPDMTRKFSGSELGWKGPWGISFPRNLTPDSATGIGSWTEAQIATALRTGHRPDGSALLPPMPWPNFVKLTDDDVQSIAAYLKSIPAVHHVNLKAVPPDQKYTGTFVPIPPPPAWDAPKAPPAAGK